MNQIRLMKREHGCYHANANYKGMKVQYFFEVNGFNEFSIVGGSVTDVSDTCYTPSVDTFIKDISDEDFQPFVELIDYTTRKTRHAECSGFMPFGGLTKAEKMAIDQKRQELYRLEYDIFEKYNSKLQKYLKHIAWKYFMKDQMTYNHFLKHFAW